jgi:anti-sigma-K factor RskA
MAMNKQEFLDLCDAYALGALDGDDLVRFREVLQNAGAIDAEMREALSSAMRAAEQLSLSAPEAAPSPAVKQRLMARIRASEAIQDDVAAAPAASPTVPRKTRAASFDTPRAGWGSRLFGAWLTPRPAYAFAFSLLVLLVGLGSYVLSLNGNLKSQQGALALAHDRILELQDSLSQKEALLEVIRSREMQLVVLSGTDNNPAGYGKILWDPERKTAVLQVSLPPQPDGTDYQLWVIRDQKPVDAGVFQVSAKGEDLRTDGLYKIDRLVETDKRHINAFAVTVEPKGGVPQPTGKMVLLGGIEI